LIHKLNLKTKMTKSLKRQTIAIEVRGGNFIMKQNAVIPIFYKTKENRTYVIDVTTRKIYWHKHKPFNVNTTFIAGCSALFVAAIVPMMQNWLASQGLDNLAVSIRVLLIFIGIIAGILVFFIAREKRNFLGFEKFMIRYPEAEGVNDSAEIEELLSDISNRVSIMKYGLVMVPLIGIVFFSFFLSNSSLLVYCWGVLFSASSGFFAIYYKDIVFLSKIKEVDDISYTKTNEMKLGEEVNSGGSEFVNVSEKKNKKPTLGCIMISTFSAAIIALVSIGIFMILSSENHFLNRNFDEVIHESDINQEYEYEYEYDEYYSAEESNGFELWGSAVQIGNHGIFTLVPIPSNAYMENVMTSENSFLLVHDEADDFFRMYVFLGDLIEGSWEEYARAEVDISLKWFKDRFTVHDYRIYKHDKATLMIVDWEDDLGYYVTSFTKISPFHGVVRNVTLCFETTDGREDFFETFGFFDGFGTSFLNRNQ